MSRRFAFIGFKDSDSANRAVKKSNGTYIRTSKIQVEKAFDVRFIKFI